jgi:hypothetical protein
MLVPAAAAAFANCIKVLFALVCGCLFWHGCCVMVGQVACLGDRYVSCRTEHSSQSQYSNWNSRCEAQQQLSRPHFNVTSYTAAVYGCFVAGGEMRAVLLCMS